MTLMSMDIDVMKVEKDIWVTNPWTTRWFRFTRDPIALTEEVSYETVPMCGRFLLNGIPSRFVVTSYLNDTEYIRHKHIDSDVWELIRLEGDHRRRWVAAIAKGEVV